MPSMIRADVSFKTTVMVGFQNVQYTGFSVTILVRRLRKVSVGEVPDIADMGKGDTVTVLSHNGRHIIFGVGVQAAGA